MNWILLSTIPLYVVAGIWELFNRDKFIGLMLITWGAWNFLFELSMRKDLYEFFKSLSKFF